MNRFYLPPEEVQFPIARLPKSEWHHAHTVLRLKRGDVVEIFDGCGHAWKAELRGNGEVELVEELPSSAPRVSICLAQAVPKGKNFDFIVQKSVELGVSRIVPLITAHTIPRLDAVERRRKREKWQRIGLEACKQCGQNVLPLVEEPMEYGEFLRGGSGVEFRMVGAIFSDAMRIRDALGEVRRRLGREPRSAMALIGPEGDFTSEEIQAAVAAGFLPVTFGPIVLRTETAALFALSVLVYELT